MNDKKRNGGIFAGKGYYIALILCAVAIGTGGYAVYRNMTKEVPAAPEETVEQLLPAASEEALEDIPVLATEPSREKPTEETVKPTEPKKKALKTMSPVSSGKEIGAYSVEALSYNQTTRDWRIHDGIDIAAEAGTPVCAAAEGVVESIREDDALGYTVVISHDGGYTTRYSSLSEEVSVKSGEAVAMGQVIGCVGDSALLETALGPHVHFSVTCKGAPLDPAEFLKLGK